MDVDGYPDVLGKRVVGAWTWLPNYNIGVATELDASEAFAPLHRARAGFGALAALSGLVAIYGFVSSRPRRRDVVETERLGCTSWSSSRDAAL